MKRQFTTRHFLAALAWLGLTLAPVATPVAMAASMEMTAVSVETASIDMPEGMPCCPDAQKKADCCAGSPFVALFRRGVPPPRPRGALPPPVTLSCPPCSRGGGGLRLGAWTASKTSQSLVGDGTCWCLTTCAADQPRGARTRFIARNQPDCRSSTMKITRKTAAFATAVALFGFPPHLPSPT